MAEWLRRVVGRSLEKLVLHRLTLVTDSSESFDKYYQNILMERSARVRIPLLPIFLVYFRAA